MRYPLPIVLLSNERYKGEGNKPNNALFGNDDN